MVIGPEARRSASGRVVVVVGLLAALGPAAIILGAGPLLVASGPLERAIGVAAIALGAVMLVAAVALASRRGPTRMLGMAGGASLAALGAIVAIAASASVAGCGAAPTRAVACVTLVGGTAAVGVGLVAAGVGSWVVVSRARPESLRRGRRSSRRR